MAISDKLTYLNTTKSQLKDQINYGLPTEKQITSSTTFREYVGSIFEAFLEALRNPDTLFTNLPKTSGSGSQITLNGTANAPMRITLNPTAISQTTYTGQQLYNYQDTRTVGAGWTSDNNGWLTCTYNNTGTNYKYMNYYTNNLNLQTSTTYLAVLEVESVSGSGSITITNYNASSQVENSNAASFSSLSNNTTYVYTFNTKSSFDEGVVAGLRTYCTYAPNENGTIKCRISVIADTTITPSTFVYQPYVGGTASPNPSYPQDIHTISGDNSVVVEGKNLLPFTNQDFTLKNVRYYVQDGSLYLNGTSTGETYGTATDFKNNFSFTLPSGTYVFSNLNRKNPTMYIKKYSDNSNLATTNSTYTTGSFTLTETTQVYLGFYIYQQTFSNELFDIQLELGETATTYTPYVSQEAQVNLGDIEYCKIGNYADRIFKNVSGDTDYSSEREEGAWYYKQGIGKVVLDGSETIYDDWQNPNQTNTRQYYLKSSFLNNNYVPSTSSNITAMTNYFKCITHTIWNYDDERFALNDSTTYSVQFKISNTTAPTLADFKTWLSTHNTIIYYVLATPTYTKITGELAQELEQVNKGMLSYDGTTNISQVNNDLAFVFNASAITK